MKKKETYAGRAFSLMKAIKRDKDGNPKTLEGAIRAVILKSPGTIRYRDDALGIIYCCLGTGIDWNAKGRLGDAMPNNYMNMPPAAGGQGCWSRDFGLDESLKQMGIFADLRKEARERHARELVTVFETIDDIDQRCQSYREGCPSWYPISWYGCHLCVPEKAQEDFRNGAIETAKLIIETKHPMGTEAWITHQRTKGYAEDILKLLVLQK